VCPAAVGPYVTGDKIAGIRNYGMNSSPLDYSDVGYDFACNTTPAGACPLRTQVHADGETWSTTNYDIHTAMIVTRPRRRAPGLRSVRTREGRDLVSARALPYLNAPIRTPPATTSRAPSTSRAPTRSVRWSRIAENATPKSDSVATIGVTTDTVPR
jgi:hypothetical protein